MERKRSTRRYGRRYKKSLAEKCGDAFRSFVAFMFSNVGIIGLVVGYTIAGASIFQAIEANSLEEEILLVQTKRNETVQKLWNLTDLLNTFDVLLWRENVTAILLEHQDFIAGEIRKNGYDGSETADRWTFASSFLYSLTVITTIGYGNVAPRTPWGKVTTILYAIIGMPLFLLYLTNIGDILARSFKWIYAKCCLCRICPGVARRRAERRRRRAKEMVTPSASSSGSRDGFQVHRSVGSLRHHPREAFPVDSSEEEEEEEEEDEDGEDSEELTESAFSYESYDPQNVTVPLTICLAIMVGYIFAGALLFSKYEDWQLLDGSYFCFISLSTIGFGDIVPGDKIYSGEGFELSFILCSMYLMLGMALIAMCFNLMQEEVIHKIRTFMKTLRRILRWSS